ncbi:unnamed protein product, partial [Sphacelaria rigidula]
MGVKYGSVKERRCWICRKQTAHFARDCPERHCMRCGKKGHSFQDCNTGENEDTAMAVG